MDAQEILQINANKMAFKPKAKKFNFQRALYNYSRDHGIDFEAFTEELDSEIVGFYLDGMRGYLKTPEGDSGMIKVTPEFRLACNDALADRLYPKLKAMDISLDKDSVTQIYITREQYNAGSEIQGISASPSATED